MKLNNHTTVINVEKCIKAHEVMVENMNPNTAKPYKERLEKIKELLNLQKS